jgi:hypothetical protein
MCATQKKSALMDHATFDAMLLNPTTVANDNFTDDWGAADRDMALALSIIDGVRLKD